MSSNSTELSKPGEGKAEFLKLAAELYDRMTQEDQEQVITFDQIEDRALEVGGKLERWLVQKRLAKPEQVGQTASCPKCERVVKALPKLHKRKLRGRTGEVDFERHECFCPSCRKAFFPSGQRTQTGR